MGESVFWGVWLDKGGEHGEPRWYEHHRGGPALHTEEHARALADTLNRGGTSGVCEARRVPMNDDTSGVEPSWRDDCC